MAAHAVLTAVVVGLFLTTPWPNDLRGYFCMRYVKVAPGAGFPFNCDSPEFLRVARQPDALLERRSFRQSRPLYPLAAAGVGRIVEAVTGPAPCPERTPLCDPFHAAYVALNFAVLVVSLALFARLVWSASGWTLGVWTLGLGLLANEVVKVFFWTPHTQMFSVLGPLACVAATAHGLRHPTLTTRPAIAMGLLAGMASLAYGTFLLVPICFATGALGAGARSGATRAAVVAVAVMLAAFVVPLLGWYLTVLVTAGSFYSDETARFGHFVWLGEAVRDGGDALRVRSSGHFRKQVAATETAAGHVVALAVGALTTAALVGVRRRTLDHEARVVLVAAALTLPLLFVFLALLASHPTRLAWSVVPPLLVAAGVLFGSARTRMRPWGRRTLDLALFVWAIGWLVWEVRSGYPLT